MAQPKMRYLRKKGSKGLTDVHVWTKILAKRNDMEEIPNPYTSTETTAPDIEDNEEMDGAGLFTDKDSGEGEEDEEATEVSDNLENADSIPPSEALEVLGNDDLKAILLPYMEDGDINKLRSKEAKREAIEQIRKQLLAK